MRHLLLLMCFLGAFFRGYTQFTHAEIKVYGLTCSQCSRSVDKALQRLDFVSNVQMDLQQPTAKVQFKKGVPVDFSAMAKAVRAAGFAVGNIVAYGIFLPDGQGFFKEQGKLYYIENAAALMPEQSQALLIINKELMAASEWMKLSAHQRLVAQQKSKEAGAVVMSLMH